MTKKWKAFQNQAKDNFSNCITHCGMLDMVKEWSRYSWCSGQYGKAWIWAMLDLVLTNNYFLQHFTLSNVFVIPRTSFWSHPLLVWFFIYRKYLNLVYLYFNICGSHVDFVTVVEENLSLSSSLTDLLLLGEKFKKVESGAYWIRCLYGDIYKNISTLEDMMVQLGNATNGSKWNQSSSTLWGLEDSSYLV